MSSLARRAMARQSRVRRKAVERNIPPPVNGWNARDAKALMNPLDAVTLDNWFPAVGKVRLRKGFATHATSGMGSGNVDTLASYEVGTTLKMLAGANGNIYDATNASPSSLASGFSENRWQVVSFGGSQAWVNGTDAPQEYDGSTVGALSISGPTAANLIGCFVHQSRVYYWEENSQSFWYSATNTLGATLTEFNLSRVGQFGGNIICAGSWNVDGGSDRWGGGGVAQDLAVFVMSSGDVIVYEGDNPGDAANWGLVGVYRIGKPLDVRGIVKIGADLGIVTVEGLVSMRALVARGRSGPETTLSDNIRGAFIDAAAAYPDNTGWQATYYPRGNYGLVNVPVGGGEFHQYVANVQTGAWCRFKGQNARCWTVHDGDLYFGTTDGQIMKADTLFSDNGSDIEAEAEQAYSDFGNSSVKKVLALKPFLAGTGGIAAAVAAQFDYQRKVVPASEVTLTPVVDENWEDIETNWEDMEAVWEGASQTVVSKWLVASGYGQAIGIRLNVDTSEDLEWHGTTIRAELGGAIA